MNTNHNAVTLLHHIAGTLDRAAGAVDKTLYAPPVHYNPLITFLAFIGFMILLCVWFANWTKKK
jgi:hypothetical protein